MNAKTALYDVPLANNSDDFCCAVDWLNLSTYADQHPASRARCSTHPLESIHSIHIDAAVCRMTGCLDAPQ